MPLPFTWTLLDVDRDPPHREWNLGSVDLGLGGSHASVRLRRLHGGLRDGVDVVEVNNGLLKFTVVPTRGMGLWRATLGEMPIGWSSPVRGPVHPNLVPLDEPGGIGWLRGFDELMCRCGLESNGAPQFDAKGTLQYPLHGRIANRPAHLVELAVDTTTREIALSGTVDETRLFGNKLRMRSTFATRIGETIIRIRDEVTNVSGEPGEMELLYHTNLGHPLLKPGGKLHAAVKTLAPRDPRSAEDVGGWDVYPKAQAGAAEIVHFLELAGGSDGRTRVVLETDTGERGVSLAFRLDQLPRFTLWKNILKPEDGYVTGLEPGINFPNVRDFEKGQGRVAVLQPGETRTFELELAIHGDGKSLAAAKDEVAKIAQGVKTQVLAEPRSGWSPR